ncbi:Nucleolar protein 12 [Coemansia interrupta]|uniref:Nucleolar protein 12 n=1 Tax=Coemansia interrupta TaxID=1126814 RepID=A0A9W8HBM1_9FUNG|nr:Nucleolar protein 12 [Coemansia interrupta]
MTDLKKGELSQLLVGGAASGTVINSALDNLFKNAPPPAPAKAVTVTAQKPTSDPAAGEATDANDDIEVPIKHISQLDIGSKQKKGKRSKKDVDVDETPEESAEREEREAKAKRARKVGFGLDKEIEDEEEDEILNKKSNKSKYEPKPQDPDVLRRTIFIGNITIECITDGKVYNQLKAMCTKYGKVKSIRFRSVAFSEMLPRKVAYITGKFHSQRDSCNAYVEFTSEEAAAKAVELNGAVFQEKHIRVDRADNSQGRDMKRTVFVGNLDFATQEEELWTHFGSCGEVENVRVVRDRKTNIGKGFAYVQFVDRTSVALALKLHDTEINSRKIRVERGSEQVIKDKQEAAAAAPKKKASVTSILETTRSAKGDKPSTKKRRTARSKEFSEKRSAEDSGRGGRGGRGGSRGGRGGRGGSTRGGRGGSRDGSSRGGRGGSTRGGRGKRT